MMLAIEPFRHGRTYWMDPMVIMRTVEPWDYPQCYDCPDSINHAEAFTIADSREERWAILLDCKRNDDRYDFIVESVERFGWLRNPTLRVNGSGSVNSYGDGHHRLAAAIDLGLYRIPVTASTDSRPVSEDSGEDGGPHWWSSDLLVGDKHISEVW